MAEDRTSFDVEHPERFGDDGGLFRRRPQPPPWPRAVAEARAIEGDDAEPLGEAVDEPARDEVLDHRPVAVKEHDGLARTCFDIVETNAPDLEKSSARWIAPLGPSRQRIIDGR